MDFTSAAEALAEASNKQDMAMRGMRTNSSYLTDEKPNSRQTGLIAPALLRGHSSSSLRRVARKDGLRTADPPRKMANADIGCTKNGGTGQISILVESGANATPPDADCFHFTGINTGFFFSFTRKTRSFAGVVALAFRPTVWMSSGPS
jgi:hypothetical protein